MADWELSGREASSTSLSFPAKAGKSSIPETSMRHTTAAAYWIARSGDCAGGR